MDRSRRIERAGRRPALAAALLAMALPLVAGGLWDGITNVVATLKSDGTTNLWTEADLVDALGLLNRRYWRDMETASGRRDWHGAVASSTFRAVTNGAAVTPVRVDVFADGYVHSETGAARRVLTPAETAALIAKRKDAAARTKAALESQLAAWEAVVAQGVGTDAAQRLAFARAVVGAEDCRTRLARLESSAATNVVDVVVTPQTGGD